MKTTIVMLLTRLEDALVSKWEDASERTQRRVKIGLVVVGCAAMATLIVCSYNIAL